VGKGAAREEWTGAPIDHVDTQASTTLGLNIDSPSICAKSAVLRVASTKSFASAIAAIWASSTLVGRPNCIRTDTIRA